MGFIVLALFLSAAFISVSREGKTKHNAMTYNPWEVDIDESKPIKVSKRAEIIGKIKIGLLIAMIASWIVFILYIMFFQPSE